MVSTTGYVLMGHPEMVSRGLHLSKVLERQRGLSVWLSAERAAQAKGPAAVKPLLAGAVSLGWRNSKEPCVPTEH